jgi:hypothetical protein
MKKKQRKAVKKSEEKKPVNTRLPDDVIYRWHLFATNNKLNKENALAELINRGTK